MLILMAETDKAAKKIVGDDKILETIREHLNNLNSDEFVVGLYDAEKEEKKIINTMIKDAEERGINQGIEQGFNQGINEGIIQTAKNMLKENSSFEFISKVTGLSIDQIEKLN